MPSALLTGCTALCLLSLHNCPITEDQLQATAGFSLYDERRRQHADKQASAACSCWNVTDRLSADCLTIAAGPDELADVGQGL